MTRARVRCGSCDRPLKSGRYRQCVRGCGAKLCRSRRIPQCSDVHGGQCPHLDTPDPAEVSAS